MRHCLIYSLTLCIGLLGAIGCSEEDYSPAMSADADYAYAEAEETLADGEPGGIYTQGTDNPATTTLPAAQPGGEEHSTPNADEGRKIIYTAKVDLVVDDFAGVPASVSALAKQHGGFVAGSHIRGSDGEPRRGDWTLRIPSTRYDAFISGAQSLGQVRSINSGSQEVTAEYVDLQARVRNLKAEETRLHKHLDENTRSLKDILEVEREIARVRGEVERIQGRLNVLKDLTALSTVTLSIEEIKDFVPEATEEPGYTTQVARSWSGSIDAVGGFLTNLSLFIVGLTPWLVVIVPLGFIALIAGKRIRRSMRQVKHLHATANT